MPQYHRYVAVGDSQTEGVGDGDDAAGLRGWADRLAVRLAAENPELGYANLAVRGRTAQQIHAEQLAPALELKPDLVSIVAGMNDLMRPRCDIGEVAGHLEAMFAACTEAGAEVATFTFPDVSRFSPFARPLLPRVVALNSRVRELSSQYGVHLAEMYGTPVVTDARLWSPDRLHAGPLGHQLLADAVAEVLGLPGADDSWTRPLPHRPAPGLPATVATELRWVGTFLGPWLGRRLRGRSSGDGRTAKRPQLLPADPLPLPDSLG
ncbi:SGNH/GDSL hydrolase family protein [Streptomyces sp. XM4193]|uniref:SGNH/GDSL hydrolase family protein n=1 Tax=Streptomyces sp. XM4193 TaxID=2929782 RepID=UPI001FF8380E|nr:SGNH/GDSL hydrolase family protein [Streptomyces sp. XM4193]MCK1799144.1 SGNH/GDSL hydrolase family protein [Streptomyces sp. XM4193]